jgi:CHAD domain-containing protein
MEPEFELHRALGDELQAAAAAARQAAGDVEKDLETAVHEFRKALRRARAVLSLVRYALPAGDRREALRGLREARRALGPARDHTVAPKTLAALELDQAARSAADAVLAAVAAEAPPYDGIKQALSDGAVRAAEHIDAIVGALPPNIEWATLVDGAAAVYRDARRARKAAKHSRRDFHRWRRRSKELTYQLELLSQHGGPLVAELYGALEAATEAQGPAVDLIMVRELARSYRDRCEDVGGASLRQAIDNRLRDAIAEARRLGRKVFRSKPRKFARTLENAAEPTIDPGS